MMYYHNTSRPSTAEGTSTLLAHINRGNSGLCIIDTAGLVFDIGARAERALAARGVPLALRRGARLTYRLANTTRCDRFATLINLVREDWWELEGGELTRVKDLAQEVFVLEEAHINGFDPVSHLPIPSIELRAGRA